MHQAKTNEFIGMSETATRLTDMDSV